MKSEVIAANMKPSIGIFSVALAMAAGPTFSAPQETCESKRESIDKEMNFARANHNASRIEGLNIARQNLDRNCSNAKLRERSWRKVDEAREDLRKEEAGLERAKAQGKSAQKIAQKERDVSEAKAALVRALKVAPPRSGD